jgi:hypothetical protein
MCLMKKILVSTFLFGICNKAYFVTKFCVNTKTSFTGILDSVGAGQRDAAQCWRRCKRRPWPNMSKARAEKCWYQGCQRMKPKITGCHMSHSTPVNLFMPENTYIPFSCVLGL